MNTPLVWTGWIVGSLIVAALLAGRVTSPEGRGVFLPGETTPGHYQIESACESCHTPFGGVDQDACLGCHEAELAAAEDSHPKSKFTDPRNADRIAMLDATLCVACHVEHRPEITGAMGVTLPDDFCVYCHADITRERPSHDGMRFETCASAGCHNFHDNRAIYEDFLARHAGERETLRPARVVARTYAADGGRLRAADADVPAGAGDTAVVEEWAASAHASAGVNCSGCHAGEDRAWVAVPAMTACESCHRTEAAGFLDGKHGMRLDAALTPMSPSLARLPMRPGAFGRELDCSSCHASHGYDTRRAAVETCLECHADAHSLSYDRSPHSALWRAELDGNGAAGSGVSCATCHLPREAHRSGAADEVRVQHNQNRNLRPNEKMVRDVCIGCHGLGFSIDAMADRSLIEANFAGRPAIHVESIDMVRRRNSR